MKTFNDFQRLLGDIANLQPTIGIKNDELDNLFKTLNGDKDLDSVRKFSPEAGKEITGCTCGSCGSQS